MNGSIMGMTRPEITRKLDEIVDFAGIERYLDTPVKRFSSGMTVRLGFAVAAFLEPEILVVDEVLAVGDAEFQKKAIGKMKDVSSQGGRTVLFVSHNMGAIKNLCNSGVLLENGVVKHIGKADDTIEKYLSINPDILDVPLANRSDRVGNGRIRFTDVIFKNINDVVISEAFTNQYLKIEIHIEIKDHSVKKDDLIFACNITDAYGTFIATWVTDECQHEFSKINDGIITMVIPNLYLRPQIYNIYLQISEGTTNPQDFCDVVYTAAQLTVLNDSLHTQGIMLKEGRGHQVLIPVQFD